MLNVPIHFARPEAFIGLIVLLPIIWAWNRRRNPIGHPNLQMHRAIPAIPFVRHVPIVVFCLAVAIVICALALPQMADVGQTEVRDVRDFVVQVDVSGSMFGVINDPDMLKRVIEDEEAEEAMRRAAGIPDPPEEQGDPRDPRAAFRMQQRQQQKDVLTRVRMARYSTKQFLLTRKGDRVALFTFDDNSYPCAPLSMDLVVIGQKTRVIGMRSGGGTNFEGETGAIQTSINHFKSLGKAKTKVIILISDGEAGIGEQRAQELYAQMNEPGVTIRMYAFVVAGKENMENAYTKALKAFIEKVGGEVYWAGDPQAMAQGYARINELEKTKIEFKQRVSYYPVSSYFYWASLGAFLLFLSTALVLKENA